jgi:DnaK suppressor protein
MDDDGAAPTAEDPGSTGERAIDLTILTTVETELAEVERALARLDDGTYGTCQVCGAAIDEGRLSAAPATSVCEAHVAGGTAGL